MARILIVDDHPSSGKPLARLLELEGHATVFVESGRAALSHLRDHPTDLLILDLMMPEMSGMDVLRVVRARFPRLPVLIYSAATDPECRAEAEALGAGGFVPKAGGQFDAIRATVNALLDRERGWRA